MPRIVLAIAFAAGIAIYCAAGSANAQEPSALTLSEGLRIATTQSRTMNIARLGEAMAVSDTHIARAGLLPSINVTGSHANLAHQQAMAFGGQVINTSLADYYSYGVSIQQLLFDFRAGLSRLDASRMAMEAARLDSARIRNGVALDFVLAFYELLEADRLKDATDREIERLEAHLQDARYLRDAGVITRNDLLQAQVRLADARQKRVSSRNLAAVRAARVNELLLRPLETDIKAIEPDEAVSEPTYPDGEKTWQASAGKRTEILIVDRTLRAVDLETTAQRAEFLPKFYLRGSNDYMENPYQRYQNNWSLIFTVNFNLFEGGRSTAELQKSQDRKRQLLEQRAKIVDEIKLELRRYSLDLQDAYERILVNRDVIGQAHENLRINRKRYEEGEGTATDVLDAVTLLTTADTNHIRSVYDYRKAEAALHHAMGTDLREVYR